MWSIIGPVSYVIIALALIFFVPRWRDRNHALAASLEEIFIKELAREPRFVRWLGGVHTRWWQFPAANLALRRLQASGRIVIDNPRGDNPLAALSAREKLKARLRDEIRHEARWNPGQDLADLIAAKAHAGSRFYRLLENLADHFDPEWRARGRCQLALIAELAEFAPALDKTELCQPADLRIVV